MTGGAPTGPLPGLRIVETAGIKPAPLACSMLAGIGAEAVRIDRPASLSSGQSAVKSAAQPP